MTHPTTSISPPISVSLARRLGAIFYDYLVIVAILLVVTAFWTGIGITESHALYPLYVGFVNLTVFLYFAWCWTHGGQTIGMKIWRIVLVSTRDDPFSWIRAATRSAIAIISVACVGIGFLWMLIDNDKMTWHDRFSDARLVFVPS